MNSSGSNDEVKSSSNQSPQMNPTSSKDIRHENYVVNHGASFPNLPNHTSFRENDNETIVTNEQQRNQGSTSVSSVPASAPTPVPSATSVTAKPTQETHHSSGSILRSGHSNDEDAQVGSLSPTSSSSLSSQGSTAIEKGGSPIRKRIKPIHGFSSTDNLLAQVSLQSNPPVANEPGSKQLQHNIQDTSNIHDRGHIEDNKKPSSTSSQKVESTPSKPITQPSKQINKSRSRLPTATSGRPRSNSVPFDFHSSEKNTSSSPTSNKQLRRGKWTAEEEAYVARVIQDFNSGYLNAPPGTTLRTYLSDKLNCDPMRITKKFTGDSCIGKRVFHPAVRCSSNSALIDKAQTELDTLERRWRKRLEMQQKEAAKKQAASVAAAAVSGRILHGKAIHDTLGSNGNSAVVAQTASWLDRANAILSQSHVSQTSRKSKSAIDDNQEIKISRSSSDEVEKEMKEVEQLIHEGPVIQKTSAGLSTILQPNNAPNNATSTITSITSATDDNSTKRKVSSGEKDVIDIVSSSNDDRFQPRQSSPHDEFTPYKSHFYDKRIRRSFSHNNIQDHEDAVTLMGFLSSVHQAAASSSSTSK